MCGFTGEVPCTWNTVDTRMCLQEFSVECGICYAYRLSVGGALPEIVCDNSHCGQPFHYPCLLGVYTPLFSPCWYVTPLEAHPMGGSVFLLQWLRGLPTSRMSFNTIFGECPYCNQVSHIAALACPPPLPIHTHSHTPTHPHTHTHPHLFSLPPQPISIKALHCDQL